MFGGVGLAALVAFVLYVWLGTTFDDVPALERTADMERYQLDALIYRERRMAFALLLRTFITGLAFIVGLALCTQGGLFILRQVEVLTAISAGWGGRRDAEGAAPDGVAAGVTDSVAASLQDKQFAFSSYSPGVAFMLGGVTIMALTLWLAVPIRAVEVVPLNALAPCQEQEGGAMRLCEVVSSKGGGGDAATAPAPAAVPTDLGLPPLPASP